mgnify:CR=1 FL=1
MGYRVLAISLLVAVGVGACASSSSRSETSAVTQPAGALKSEFPASFRVGALGAQELKSGECGLFLFSGNPSPRFIFFGEAASRVGKMVLDNKEVTFVRVKGEGGVADLHFTEQSYSSPAHQLTVDISFTPEENIGVYGTRISSGTLKLQRDDGWSMVMSVGGATSCSQQ